MERYSPLELRQDMGDDDDNECDDEEIGDLYPSLMELSMGHSPSPDGSREDLMTMSLTCDEDGDFGVVLRHFTVVANVPVSFVDTVYVYVTVYVCCFIMFKVNTCRMCRIKLFYNHVYKNCLSVLSCRFVLSCYAYNTL